MIWDFVFLLEKSNRVRVTGDWGQIDQPTISGEQNIILLTEEILPRPKCTKPWKEWGTGSTTNLNWLAGFLENQQYQHQQQVFRAFVGYEI